MTLPDHGSDDWIPGLPQSVKDKDARGHGPPTREKWIKTKTLKFWGITPSFWETIQQCVWFHHSIMHSVQEQHYIQRPIPRPSQRNAKGRWMHGIFINLLGQKMTMFEGKSRHTFHVWSMWRTQYERYSESERWERGLKIHDTSQNLIKLKLRPFQWPEEKGLQIRGYILPTSMSWMGT